MRVKRIVLRVTLLTAISIVLASVPSDRGPAQSRSVAAAHGPRLPTVLLYIAGDADR